MQVVGQGRRVQACAKVCCVRFLNFPFFLSTCRQVALVSSYFIPGGFALQPKQKFRKGEVIFSEAFQWLPASSTFAAMWEPYKAPMLQYVAMHDSEPYQGEMVVVQRARTSCQTSKVRLVGISKSHLDGREHFFLDFSKKTDRDH